MDTTNNTQSEATHARLNARLMLTVAAACACVAAQLAAIKTCSESR